MQRISRGKGFAGVLRYAAKGEENIPGRGRLIGGNMAGSDEKSLAIEFKIIAEQRPDIEKPVWHNALRLPKGELISEEKWIAIVADYLKKMGLDPEKNQHCAWIHDDEEGQHAHIIANRVALDGSVYLGQNENLRSTRMIAQLERAYGLTITKGVTLDADGKVVMPETSGLKKGEIEKALRTGEKPPRLVLQEIVAEAMAGRPTTGQFMERLEAAGVEVLPNIAGTGRMNGFSFRLDGLKFSGTALGTKFKWAALSKEIDYDEIRDREGLAARRDAERSREADGPIAGAAPAPTPSPRPAPTPADASSGTGGGDRADRPSTAGNPGNAEVDRPAIADGGEGPADGSDWEGPHAGSELDADETASRMGLDDAARAIQDVARPVQQKDVAAKLAAWEKQHAALNAPAYRITLTDRVLRGGVDRTHNVGKLKDGGGEMVYPADAVARMIPKLRAANARGFDVYITPIDKGHHYIVVDDMTPEKLAGLKQAAYQPALVLSSSANNMQAIIKAPRMDRKDEQSLANRLVVDLNQEFGDPAFSGVIHPFRMAGFSNKKAGRNNAFTRIVEVAGAICAKAMRYLADLREKIDSEAAMKVAEAKRDARADRIAQPSQHAQAGLARTYQEKAYWHVKQGRLIKDDGSPDWSRIDYAVCCDLLRSRYTRADLVRAMQEASPELAIRHNDAEDYVRRTVRAAVAKVGEPAPDNGTDIKPAPK